MIYNIKSTWLLLIIGCAFSQPSLLLAKYVRGPLTTVVQQDADGSEVYSLRQKILSKKDKDSALYHQDLRIQMKRLVRHGAQPVILSHAVVLNFQGVEEIGKFLHRHGFDVWMPNMMGHGNGKEASKIRPYTRGDYGFDKIVTRDWPLVHDVVRAESGKDPLIIGYSMGGMSWQQYLSGVYEDEESGETRQSDALARERGSRTLGFVGLTVPEELSSVSPTVQRLVNPFFPLLKRVDGHVPLTTDTSSEKSGWGKRERVRRLLIDLVSPVALRLLPAGILIRQNGSSDEARTLMKQYISSPHSDLVSDLIRWMRESYVSRDGLVDYGNLKRVFTRTLLIAASEDRLATPEHILNKQTMYPKEAAVRLRILQGFAHVDIAFMKGVPLVGYEILNFVREIHLNSGQTLPVVSHPE